MRQPPLQITLLTEPDLRASAAAGEPRTKPRLHLVTLPGHADRQDLVMAYHQARGRNDLSLGRVYAAALGLTTRIGRESGADFGACSCNVFVYGGKVLDFLAEQGLDVQTVSEVAAPIVTHIFEALAPSSEEVKAVEVFSEAGAAPATSSPSGSPSGT